jgi:hypothetical protein
MVMSLKSIYNKIVLHRWDIGISVNSIDAILRGEGLKIKYVKYPFNGRWFADPFILDYDDERIVLLVEDYADSDKKGKISRLIINRKTMKIEDVKIILELDSHLSFPAIIRSNGVIFIYPENSQGRGLVLYEYNQETETCHEVKYISDQPFADAVITQFDGEDYLFSINAANPKMNTLEVWYSNQEQYELVQELGFQEAIARNAGDFFNYKGELYRPAQECNYMYGHSISLQRVEKEKDGFRMQEVRRILPPSFCSIGIHTFNVYKDLIVVDLKVFRHPWVAIPLFRLRNLFKK